MAQILTGWELAIQANVRAALEDTSTDPTFEIEHPTTRSRMATVTITVDLGDPALEEYVVEVEAAGSDQTSNVAWTMIRRVLTSVCPPSQAWDRYGMTFSQMTPVGHHIQQIEYLRRACDSRELLAHEPGTVSHYGHRPHIAVSTVEGKAIRALCGVSFVVGQDHTPLPVCPDCATKYGQLPT